MMRKFNEAAFGKERPTDYLVKCYPGNFTALGIGDESAPEGFIKGTGSVFNVIDSYGDIMHKGAFKRSILTRGPGREDEKGNLIRSDIILLNQHNIFDPAGLPTVLKERKNDLYYEGQLNLEKQSIKDLFSDIKFGTIKRNSVGFEIQSFDWEKRDVEGSSIWLRNIYQVKLFELSPVTFAAVEETEIIDAKAASEFSALLRSAGVSSTSELREIISFVKTLMIKDSSIDTPDDDPSSSSDSEKKLLHFLDTKTVSLVKEIKNLEGV